MRQSTVSGSCLCGSIRYQLNGQMKYLCNCHCESCRRGSGAPYVAWGTVDRSDFAVITGTLSIIQSSPDVERGFCGDCGASLTYANSRRVGEIDITLATLDRPGDFMPRSHIWVEDKLPWVVIADELPQYRTTVSAND